MGNYRRDTGSHIIITHILNKSWVSRIDRRDRRKDMPARPQDGMLILSDALGAGNITSNATCVYATESVDYDESVIVVR